MALSDRVVVMDRGHALQVGPPEAIYQRPASRQVAAFFGAPNLLDARVTACHPHGTDGFRLAVEGAGWRGACQAGAPYRPEEPVTVLVRPENVAINAAASGSAATSGQRGDLEQPGRLRHPLAGQGDGLDFPRAAAVAEGRDRRAGDPGRGDCAVRRPCRRPRRAQRRPGRGLGDPAMRASRWSARRRLACRFKGWDRCNQRQKDNRESDHGDHGFQGDRPRPAFNRPVVGRPGRRRGQGLDRQSAGE